MASRATKTATIPSATEGSSARHAARMMRRARLRATAPPTRRLTTNPARAPPASGATYSITRAPADDFPVRRTVRTSVEVPLRSAGQAASTLGPAASEDGPAGPRAHADPKAVGLLATANMGLERLLHRIRRPRMGRSSQYSERRAELPRHHRALTPGRGFPK